MSIGRRRGAVKRPGQSTPSWHGISLTCHRMTAGISRANATLDIASRIVQAERHQDAPKRDTELPTPERLKVHFPSKQISGSAVTPLTAFAALARNANLSRKFRHGKRACRSPCQGQPRTNRMSATGQLGDHLSESYSNPINGVVKTGFQLHPPWQQPVEATEAKCRSGIAPVSRLRINASGLTAPPSLTTFGQNARKQNSDVPLWGPNMVGMSCHVGRCNEIHQPEPRYSNTSYTVHSVCPCPSP